jgi:23S rRNA (guanosine2251-2'-O)-methyltransferase
MLTAGEAVNTERRALRPAREGMRTKSRTRREAGEDAPLILYGLHAVRAALANPRRRARRLVATRNALQRFEEEGLRLPAETRVAEPREIDRLLGPDAVHQGAALYADPLPEPPIEGILDASLLLVLDQVTDPHNVGAILRSAAAFGVAAVVTTGRHAPAETGVLAKAASGALEHVPFVRVTNLARGLEMLGAAGFERLGLDSEHAEDISRIDVALKTALVLGAEGKGLRRLTRETCDRLVRIPTHGPILSLNVSNAAAVALYAVTCGGARPAAAS